MDDSAFWPMVNGWRVPPSLSCPFCGTGIKYLKNAVWCGKCDQLFELIPVLSGPMVCIDCGEPLTPVDGDGTAVPAPRWDARRFARLGQFLRCPQAYTASHSPPAYLRAELLVSPPCLLCGSPIGANNSTTTCFWCARRAFGHLCPGADQELRPEWLEPNPERAVWASSYVPRGPKAGRLAVIDAFVIELRDKHKGQHIAAGRLQARFPGTPFLYRLGFESGSAVWAAVPFGASFKDGTDPRDQLVVGHVFAAGLPLSGAGRELRAAYHVLGSVQRIIGAGRPPAKLEDVVGRLDATIAAIRQAGIRPTKRQVALRLFPDGNEPAKSLNLLLGRHGIDWQELIGEL